MEQLDNELLSAVEEPPPPPSAAAGVDAGSRGSPLTAQLQAPEQLASKLSAMNRLLRTQEAELQRRDEQLAALQAENARLVREQAEMRRFLADYGLQWVGGSKPSSAGPSSAAPPPKPTPAPAPPPPAAPPARAHRAPAAGGGALPDMEAVRRAIDELNGIASGSGGIVRRRDGSHGFEEQALSLTFWRDGLQVNNGPLREYGGAAATAFLRDLLDGYFPYELKHAFPEGVPFALVDRSDREQRAAGPNHSWGSGRRLDSRSGRGRGTTSLLGDSRDFVLPDLAAAAVADDAGGEVGGGEPCRLQVKDENGAVACVLTLGAAATLADVRAELAARGAVRGGSPFELRTAFPARTLADEGQTLAAAGLAPAATLCMRPLP